MAKLSYAWLLALTVWTFESQTAVALLVGKRRPIIPFIGRGAISSSAAKLQLRASNNIHANNDEADDADDIKVVQGNSPFYSAAQSFGNLVFTSGQVGFAPGTRTLVEGGIGPQTRQTLENLKAVLEETGVASLDQVMKTTCYLEDIADYDAFNQVYLEYFSKEVKPARVCFGPGGLPLGALVEIDAIAVSSS
jgi:2-iminobutanoate/2-iminopropanoate deaminase